MRPPAHRGVREPVVLVERIVSSIASCGLQVDVCGASQRALVDGVDDKRPPSSRGALAVYRVDAEGACEPDDLRAEFETDVGENADDGHKHEDKAECESPAAPRLCCAGLVSPVACVVHRNPLKSVQRSVHNLCGLRFETATETVGRVRLMRVLDAVTACRTGARRRPETRHRTGHRRHARRWPSHWGTPTGHRRTQRGLA